MITLVLVDCQSDFITGTLSVKKCSRSILEPIKKYIKIHKEDIDKIIFTVDWHPINHCSFKKQGGPWPQHCVQYTPGACIEPKLFKYINSLDIPYEIVQKGTDPEREEYGAFEDISEEHDLFGGRIYLTDTVYIEENTDLVVCGIAGDYCVKETLQNLIKGGLTPKVYMPGIASIDGGKTLSAFIKENEIEKVV